MTYPTSTELTVRGAVFGGSSRTTGGRGGIRVLSLHLLESLPPVHVQTQRDQIPGSPKELPLLDQRPGSAGIILLERGLF